MNEPNQKVSKLTKNQKIGIGVGIGVIVLGSVLYFVFKGKDTPKPKPTNTPTPTPTSSAVPEVYYADKGGTDKTRYAFTSSAQAEAHAKSLGGTIATYRQLKDAVSKGLDVCWYGWGKDDSNAGCIYTATSTDSNDITCGSVKDVIDFTHVVKKGGVWVYGVKKPKTQYTDCIRSTVPCVLPFSKTKWSQY